MDDLSVFLTFLLWKTDKKKVSKILLIQNLYIFASFLFYWPEFCLVFPENNFFVLCFELLLFNCYSSTVYCMIRKKKFEKNQPSCRISSGRFVFKTVYYFISAFNLLHFSQSKSAGLQMWLCSFLRRLTQSNFSNLLRLIRKTTYFTKFLLQWIQCISKNWRRIDLINVLAFSREKINFMLGVFGVP